MSGNGDEGTERYCRLESEFLMRLYYTLADYPHDMIEIECAKCGRHGRLRTGSSRRSPKSPRPRSVMLFSIPGR